MAVPGPQNTGEGRCRVSPLRVEVLAGALSPDFVPPGRRRRRKLEPGPPLQTGDQASGRVFRRLHGVASWKGWKGDLRSNCDCQAGQNKPAVALGRFAHRACPVTAGDASGVQSTFARYVRAAATSIYRTGLCGERGPGRTDASVCKPPTLRAARTGVNAQNDPWIKGDAFPGGWEDNGAPCGTKDRMSLRTFGQLPFPGNALL